MINTISVVINLSRLTIVNQYYLEFWEMCFTIRFGIVQLLILFMEFLESLWNVPIPKPFKIWSFIILFSQLGHSKSTTGLLCQLLLWLTANIFFRFETITLHVWDKKSELPKIEDLTRVNKFPFHVFSQEIQLDMKWYALHFDIGI